MLAGIRGSASVRGPAPAARPSRSGGVSRLPARSGAAAPAKGAQAQRLLLNIGETTVGVPFSKEQAVQLDAAFSQLLKTFAEKQKAERPKRWDMMEVRFAGEEGLDLFELFCNPNAHATVVDAKLLLTIKAGAVSVTTEGRLSGIKADLENFMATADS